MAANGHKSDQLANEILRQIVRMENTRVWRAQPGLAVDVEIPAKFHVLLEEIDRAERRQARVRH
jgi:hypothetical protein